MLSVIVITKNEAHNLARCLDSVVGLADEIIVLDSGSDDETVEIAKRYTSRVYVAPWEGYGLQKQRALSYATGQWVLNLDADESVDAKLRESITRAIASDEQDAYRIPIQMCFYGKRLKFSSSPSRHVRLFKRMGANYSNAIVHEKVLLPQDSRIGKIKEPILHHSFKDISQMIQKLDKYSSYSAKIKLEKRQKTTISMACLSSFWMFFRCYFLQLGMLDGKMGLLFAVYHANASFYRAVKQVYPDSEMKTLPGVI